MEFTFNSDQAMAAIMLIFIVGAAFGTWWEKNHSGLREEVEALEDEVEALQTEILKAEKDKDFLRELLWDANNHPAVKHLIADRNRARKGHR